jgi:DNA polymerase-3 subunit alpha
LLALVTEVRRITTRTQRSMAVVKLEDLTGSIEAVLFPQAFEQFGGLLDEDAVLIVTGKADVRNDELQLLVDEVRQVEDMAQDSPAAPSGDTVLMRVTETGIGNVDRLYQLAQLLREFPGDDELVLVVEIGQRERAFRLGLRVDWSAHLEAAVTELLGASGVEHGADSGRDEVVSVAPSRAA